MRVLVVGDAYGVPKTLRALPADTLVLGIVAAVNRPQYHDALGELAASLSVPLLVQPHWEHDGYAEFIAKAERLGPELIVCNSYSMLLRTELLSLPRHGAVNVHPGRLPDFRGPNPLQWAMIEDERSTDVTLHWIAEDLDAGDVIASRSVAIGFEDGWRDVWARLEAATDELLDVELPTVFAGTAGRVPQDPTRARRRPRRTPEDGRIDWSRSVLEIYNHIRALGDGLPPAFYELEGERIPIDRRLPIGEVTALAFAPGPGGRTLRSGRTYLVTCASPDPSFSIEGGNASSGGVQLDTDRRLAHIWTDEPDDAATELLREFARSELGFEPA